MSSQGFKLANSSAPPPEDITSFHLRAPSNSDIWRTPAREAFNGATFMRTLPISSFSKARVTVSASWKRLYDQGGLLIILPAQGAQGTKWVKTGIEVFDGHNRIACVATDSFSDCSLVPTADNRSSATIEVERKVGGDGSPTTYLLVFLVEGARRTRIREVTWFFDGQEGDIQVGAYAVKPSAAVGVDSEDFLEVSFTDLIIA
ncbi:MAG: hypothetical protein M1829_000250 [Trizodia sp. TS-e1964]|nr:MAG: hypothetical protein M1829_000250 [Trizodia sp. TS-e1964]